MASRSSHAPQEGLDCCEHAGYYSGRGLYSRDSQMLRYVLVCDDCGEEMKELSALDYAPAPVFAGI